MPPGGNENSTEVEVRPGVPAAGVNGLEEIFEDSTAYTPEDQQTVREGGAVRFKLVIEKQGNPPEAGR